ncbi:MAG: 50S ribosomal protein L23 [Alphaproteobacteria bacterium]|jgi:large subunit ribosomal protein L23|nr:50S ribosomal protein L23 [Alphaproteobacteria bacterium]
MKKYSGRNVKPSKERIFELIRSPVVTEKATMVSEHNQVVFWVPLDANKFEIRAAVEDLFKVKVTAVNTLRKKGKVKRFRGFLGKQNETKKAVVTLAEGQNIDIMTGI